MSLTKFTENTNVISELADSPTLSAPELKAKFDEAGTKIKNYLNNTLTPETEQLVATEKAGLQSQISSLRTETQRAIEDGQDEIEGEMSSFRTEVNQELSTQESNMQTSMLNFQRSVNSSISSMQSSIDNINSKNRGTLLYSGSSASSFSLSQSVSNFDYIKVLCVAMGKYVNFEMPNANGRKLALSVPNPSAGQVYYATLKIDSIYGTISDQIAYSLGSTNYSVNTTYIQVVEVRGFNY